MAVADTEEIATINKRRSLARGDIIYGGFDLKALKQSKLRKLTGISKRTGCDIFACGGNSRGNQRYWGYYQLDKQEGREHYIFIGKDPDETAGREHWPLGWEKGVFRRTLTHVGWDKGRTEIPESGNWRYYPKPTRGIGPDGIYFLGKGKPKYVGTASECAGVLDANPEPIRRLGVIEGWGSAKRTTMANDLEVFANVIDMQLRRAGQD